MMNNQTTFGLQRLIGYNFHHQALLTQALTHRSFGSINNERLEFLGDGVLNFIIASQLYLAFPKLDEGDLSRLRAHLVKEPTLAELALMLNIGEALRLGEGELKSGGWRRPSVLADALEAIIGAVFLDAGFDAAEMVVIKLFTPLIEKIDPKSIGKDPKSLLQEYLQSKKSTCLLMKCWRLKVRRTAKHSVSNAKLQNLISSHKVKVQVAVMLSKKQLSLPINK